VRYKDEMWTGKWDNFFFVSEGEGIFSDFEREIAIKGVIKGEKGNVEIRFWRGGYFTGEVTITKSHIKNRAYLALNGQMRKW
jgi:hypothetical protein